MTTEHGSSDFYKRRPTDKALVARVRAAHGLPEDASLAEIEPVAKALWERMPARPEVMEMILGRVIDSDDIMTDPEIGRLVLLEDPEQAFSMLSLYATLGDIEAGESEQ